MFRPLLTRIGAFLDPAQIHMDEDGDDVQPKCADCGEPASEQVHTGWSQQPGSTVVRAVFRWLCDGCAETRDRQVITRGRFPWSGRTVDEL